jgi:hypothetical protein
VEYGTLKAIVERCNAEDLGRDLAKSVAPDFLATNAKMQFQVTLGDHGVVKVTLTGDGPGGAHPDGCFGHGDRNTRVYQGQVKAGLASFRLIREWYRWPADPKP